MINSIIKPVKNFDKLILTLAFLYFISRLLFVNYYPVFFDSPQYLDRFAHQNLLNALTSGHLPLHSGYILVFWPIFKIDQLLSLNPAQIVVFGQIILSFFGIVCFYKFVKTIFDKTIAITASIIISLVPLFWISNVTIMMESTYIPFFFISIFFLSKNLTKNNKNEVYLYVSALFFAISFLTHTVVILWLPFIFFTAYYLNKKLLTRTLIAFLTATISASLINGYLISIAANTNILHGTFEVYTSKLNERSLFDLNLEGILRYSRNFIVPLFRNYTFLVVLLAFFSIIKVYKSNKKLFIFFFLLVIPSFITNQWWDSLFFGRHSLISAFGLAILAALIISRNSKFTMLTFFYLVLVSIPALSLLKLEIPYIRVANEVQKLPGNGLLIESHFARPQVSGKYNGDIIFVEEPGWNKDELSLDIKDKLLQNKPVFITSQALSEPYGLYSGPYLHNLALSYRNDFVLRKIIKNFTLEKKLEISKKDNLIIYEIISTESSAYPEIPNMKYHQRRIDFYDPFVKAWMVLDRNLN